MQVLLIGIVLLEKVFLPAYISSGPEGNHLGYSAENWAVYYQHSHTEMHVPMTMDECLNDC